MSNSTRARVGVVFGGRSFEHEVSLRSASSVMSALDPSRYQIVKVGITKGGRWLVGGDPMAALVRDADPRMLKDGLGQPGSRTGTSPTGPDAQLLPPSSLFEELDVVFPVLHGPNGEDGTVQGLFELAGVAYVGAGVAASALAMDKALFKDVAAAHGLPQVGHLQVDGDDFHSNPGDVSSRILDQLGLPVFTKPANLGSSVGISKCRDRSGLEQGLAAAFRYDHKVVVERAVANAREIEVAVLGNGRPEASVPGEIEASREFYDYEAKYIDDGAGASRLLIPAPLPSGLTDRVRQLAIEAYQVIGCAGLARVDFLIEGDTETVYLNEINTMPGFTSISMYPKLWEATELAYADLVSRLLDLAFERHQGKRAWGP